MLYQANLFATITSALLKFGYWVRQGAFSEMLFNQYAAILTIRVTNAELNPIYKSNDGIDGLLNYPNICYAD